MPRLPTWLSENSFMAGEEGGRSGRWCVRPRKDADSCNLRTKQLRTRGDKRPLILREGRYGRSHHRRCHDQRHCNHQEYAPHKRYLLLFPATPYGLLLPSIEAGGDELVMNRGRIPILELARIGSDDPQWKADTECSIIRGVL